MLVLELTILNCHHQIVDAPLVKTPPTKGAAQPTEEAIDQTVLLGRIQLILGGQPFVRRTVIYHPGIASIGLGDFFFGLPEKIRCGCFIQQVKHHIVHCLVALNT